MIEENKVVEMSPVPKIVDASTLKDRPIVYSFTEAMQGVIDGKKMTRPSWPSGSYLFRDEGYLRVFRDGKKFDLIVTDGDMLSNDWVEYAEAAN